MAGRRRESDTVERDFIIGAEVVKVRVCRFQLPPLQSEDMLDGGFE